MSGKTLLLTLLVAAAATGACAREAPAAPPPLVRVETSLSHPPVAPPAVELLRAWDAERADAWARGDPGRLSRLYTRGSRAGRRDREMLRAWTDRDLVVRELHTQLLAVRELGRSRSTWTLQVTDRLSGGVAIGPDVHRTLPVDTATTRTVVLRRLHGRWLVASVR
jgi:hypothetical protein